MEVFQKKNRNYYISYQNKSSKGIAILGISRGMWNPCIPDDWNDGYENVTVGCTVENQKRADCRPMLFNTLPIKHKNISCQPLIERINITQHLKNLELVGGESDRNARPLNYDWVLSIREQCIERRFNLHYD